jgi:hypothetical protein
MSKYADYSLSPASSTDRREIHPVVKKMAQVAVAGLLTLMVVGCNVGPNYKRPATLTPQSFRAPLRLHPLPRHRQHHLAINNGPRSFRIPYYSGSLLRRYRTISISA